MYNDPYLIPYYSKPLSHHSDQSTDQTLSLSWRVLASLFPGLCQAFVSSDISFTYNREPEWEWDYTTATMHRYSNLWRKENDVIWLLLLCDVKKMLLSDC